MICYVMGWYDGGVRHCHGVVVVVQAVGRQWLGFTRSHHQARAEGKMLQLLSLLHC